MANSADACDVSAQHGRGRRGEEDGAALRTPFPSYLPNPGRILLGALDYWATTCAEEVTDDERTAAARALSAAIQAAGTAAQPRLEAIHLLVRAEQPLPTLDTLIRAGPSFDTPLLR